MNTKIFRIIVLISILALISLACGSFFGGDDEKGSQKAESSQEEMAAESEEEEDKGAGKDKDEDEIKKPSVFEIKKDVELGDEYRSEEGGFSFSTVPNYDVEEFFGLAAMAPPDANDQSGPIIVMMGGLNDEELDLDMLYDETTSDMDTGIKVTNKQEITIDGVPAISADVSGPNESGEQITGRLVVASVTPMQQFNLIAYSSPDRWEDDLAPLVDAVIPTIKFFEPKEIEFDFDEEAMEDIEEEVDVQPETSYEEVNQWASSAIASSQYGSKNWAAYQAAGAPDTFVCGDEVTAWASSSPYTREWIELSYDLAVTPVEVNIHQTYNPSQVVKVELYDLDGKSHEIYSASATDQSQCPYVLSIDVDDADYETNSMKITIDQTYFGNWNEIDAVELIGLVQTVTTSSSTTSTSSSGYAGYIYTPDDVGAGDFYYEISGVVSDNDIESGYLQDMSTSDEYVLGLISSDGKYLLSLYIPADVSGEEIVLEEYSSFAEEKAPSASFFVDADLYYGYEGVMTIEVDSSNNFSGAFSLSVYDSKDIDNYVYIDGAFNQFALELAQ